jgi:3-phosphoshikimate 1-carboxyvinyltransferase
MKRIVIPAPRPAEATVDVPGDKSISHRALMCASIARGTSTIVNANLGEDVNSTRRALCALGVAIEDVDDGTMQVAGIDAFSDPQAVIDCGNSGTTMRMLAGLIAGSVNAVLDGDDSLRRRPMERVAQPLRQMGADVSTGADGRPPLSVRRVDARLRGSRIEMNVASAQVKSAILFAGLRASGETTVVEPLPTRDHTERMFRAMGADIDVHAPLVTVRPSRLQAIERWEIPGDFSAAFFFIAGAALLPGAHVAIRNVGVNASRIAALDVVTRMGADVAFTNRRDVCGEPVADVTVRGRAGLRAAEIRPDQVPNLIDEIPALCALAAGANGEFAIRGAAELRTKESDRIATTAALLRAFGADVQEFTDGLTVRGGRPLRAPERVSTGGDHRIGMSAALLALATGAAIEIDGADCIATSFPGFEAAWCSAFARTARNAAE